MIPITNHQATTAGVVTVLLLASLTVVSAPAAALLLPLYDEPVQGVAHLGSDDLGMGNGTYFHCNLMPNSCHGESLTTCGYHYTLEIDMALGGDALTLMVGYRVLSGRLVATDSAIASSGNPVTVTVDACPTVWPGLIMFDENGFWFRVQGTNVATAATFTVYAERIPYN